MRTLACLMMLAGCALAGRLENTYLPPPGAAQAGGVNLAAPFRSPQNTYLPPGSGSSSSSGGSALRAGGSTTTTTTSFNAGASGSSGFNAAGSSFGASSGSAFNSAGRYQQQQQQAQVNSYSGSFQQPTPRPALIIKQVNENPGDGTYTFSYETENGIQAEERGQVRADGAEGLAAVQGAYAFTAPDNNVRYTVTYTADENGFLAYGDHLPTPPPVPAEILRALEQNAADEARGIVDDGQYRAEHQDHQQQQQGGFLRGSGGSSGYSSGSSSGYSSGSSSGYNSGSSNNNAGYNSGSSNNNAGYSSGSNNNGYHY